MAEHVTAHTGEAAENSLVTRADRLQRLVETGIALSSELSLEALLLRLTEAAVELTGATYGALGLVDRLGVGLERFITVGIDPETRTTIGDPPRGRGILGALISAQAPLRLRDLGQDARSVGFPPGHPPMASFLGVPILLRGVTFGNLYLTEKRGGEEFSEEDEELARMLAGQAGVAIENARLYESSRQWSRQLESLNEVTAALLTEADLAQIFDLAAQRLRELLDARVAFVEVPTPERAGGLVIAAASGENAEALLGVYHEQRRSKAGRVFLRARAERVDSLIDDPEVDQAAPRILSATAALFVPLIVRDGAVGVIVVYDKHGRDPRFSDADLRVAQAFATRAALALELSERVGRESVRALLHGQELERTRLARELHDETGQALTSILLGLKAAEQELGAEQVQRIRTLVASALADVRRLAVELRPAVLDDFGLEPALERLVRVVSERSGLVVRLNVDSQLQALPPELETALYRIVQEGLTNVVKHARASAVSIVLAGSEGNVRLLIEDDGVGFDPSSVRTGAFGLIGMRERVSLLRGRLLVESEVGAGATVIIDLPLPARDA